MGRNVVSLLAHVRLVSHCGHTLNTMATTATEAHIKLVPEHTLRLLYFAG